jgi:hypothetical protein
MTTFVSIANSPKFVAATSPCAAFTHVNAASPFAKNLLTPILSPSSKGGTPLLFANNMFRHKGRNSSVDTNPFPLKSLSNSSLLPKDFTVISPCSVDKNTFRDTYFSSRTSDNDVAGAMRGTRNGNGGNEPTSQVTNREVSSCLPSDLLKLLNFEEEVLGHLRNSNLVHDPHCTCLSCSTRHNNHFKI